MHICNLSTCEAEAKGFEVQGHLPIQTLRPGCIIGDPMYKTYTHTYTLTPKQVNKQYTSRKQFLAQNIYLLYFNEIKFTKEKTNLKTKR